MEPARTSSLVMPHILRGDITPSSLRALMPGLSSSRSDAFVPSMTSGIPSLSAIIRTLLKISLLHR